MKKLNFDAPLNSLSLGNVSLNFLRELKGRDIDISIHPMGDKGDFTAFDKIDEDFKTWVQTSVYNRLKKLDRSTPTLKIWHINGSEKKVGDKQYLYTFYEVDSPTDEEISIVKAQEHVFFSSSEAAETFKTKGCENVSHVPLGFDSDFYTTNKSYLDKDVVHFGLIGKFERRKNTQAIIQLWLQKYGNNPKYQLSCLINNPFFNEEQTKQAIHTALGGGRWSNINFLPHLKTNSEVNELINSFDIDLSGLSNGEGWNLPSFNATALGKWSVVSNCSSHKDWATPENCILVEPSGKQPCYDNFFFRQGDQFNQGQYYKLNADLILEGLEKAEKKVGQMNMEGLKLQDKFTYSKSIDMILEKIHNNS
tara:strand:- start:25 stop:1119 length:1095 start_codon:yes stop_codon:yes gene_type:complete